MSFGRSWLGVVALLAVATGAQANVVWQDNVGYVDTNGTQPVGGWFPVKVTTSNPYNFTHNIADSGFNASLYTITNVDLDIWLADDGNDGSEQVRFSWDGSAWTAPQEVDGSIYCNGGCSWDDFLNLAPSAALLSDGLLAVTVQASTGDFYFKRSHLTVTGRRINVPEPATLGALGLGLVALGAIRRRRPLAAR